MTPPPARIPVTLLGATGAVGQKFVTLLAGHPWFSLVRLCASERNVGKPYGDAVRWLEPSPLPPAIAAMPIEAATPTAGSRIAFSALDADAAMTIEPACAAAGQWVVTNARPFRMDEDVPLLIPEINPDALALLDRQRTIRGWPGAIVANPNCSVVVLASALAPLHRAFGVERVVVTTLQALSGAGYPGVPSLDSLANTIPFISGEEDKIERETCKILAAAFPVSAQVNRVPVLDGHTVSVSVALRDHPSPEVVRAAFADYSAPPDVAALPSAPARFFVVDDAPDRPQPRLDAGRGGGMTVSIGRIRPCPVLGIRFVALGHNTLRGAAGAAVLNAELLVARGLVGGGG